MPDPFKVAPLRIERPGTEPARNRVPANPLRSADDLVAGDGDGEFPKKEIAVVNGTAGERNDRLVRLIEPFAREPIELLKLFAMAAFPLWRIFADCRHLPFAAGFRVHRDVSIVGPNRSVAPSNRCGPVFDSDHRIDEAD